MENLNKTDLIELNNNQAKKINGGGIGWFAGFLLSAAVTGVIEGFRNDWKEVKEAYHNGVQDGMN